MRNPICSPVSCSVPRRNCGRPTVRAPVESGRGSASTTAASPAAPGPDSVPVEKIEPYVEKLARLKVIKRGFQVNGDDDAPKPPAETLSREERKKQREERKKQREERNQLKTQGSDGASTAEDSEAKG